MQKYWFIPLLFLPIAILQSRSLDEYQPISLLNRTVEEQLKFYAEYYKNYTERYGRKFDSEVEYEMRFETFVKNLKRIEEWNSDENDTAEYSVTQFTDWTDDELVAYSLLSSHLEGNATDEAKIYRYGEQYWQSGWPRWGSDRPYPYYPPGNNYPYTQYPQHPAFPQYGPRPPPNTYPAVNPRFYQRRWPYNQNVLRGDTNNAINPAASQVRTIRIRRDNSPIPENWDWRWKNVVTRVKEQASKCASCWAYAAIGAAESAYAIKHGRRIELSESELVDCDETNEGCISGSFRAASRRGAVHGFVREENYPFMKWHNRGCPRGEIFVKTLYDIPSNAEDIRWFIYKYGPVSLNMAMPVRYKSYRRGILRDIWECHQMDVDHAVTAVGFGTDQRGIKYWIIKNSWGDWWGEDGYFRIERDRNACQIESNAFSVGF